MTRFTITAAIAAAFGVLTMLDTIDAQEKAKTTTVKSTEYDPATGKVLFEKTKEIEIKAPNTTTIKIEVTDPKTGKVQFVAEGVPARRPKGTGPAWYYDQTHADIVRPRKGDKITADGKVYILIADADKLQTGPMVCKFKEAEPDKKP